MSDWFEGLFGFVEGDWGSTCRQFELRDDMLCSRVNGRSFAVGRFSTPSLGQLRARAASLPLPSGRLQVHHEVIGDVLELHALPANEGAMFQVASQFNCLEFAGPDVVPEDGVTNYAYDRTQGPACSLAAGAATVYRNYFAPVDGQVGQTRDKQIDNLAGLAEAVGPLWTVRNGYTSATAGQLARLATAVQQRDRDELLAQVRIGLHQDVGVTFARRFEEPDRPQRVSQAFCSAVSCAYTDLPRSTWEPLATLALDAAYEATLWAAAIDAAEGAGSGKVWLTFLGGGVFGNDDRWIAGAIGRALARVRHVGLRVHIAHYRQQNSRMSRAILQAAERGSAGA